MTEVSPRVVTAQPSAKRAYFPVENWSVLLDM